MLYIVALTCTVNSGFIFNRIELSYGYEEEIAHESTHFIITLSLYLLIMFMTSLFIYLR